MARKLRWSLAGVLFLAILVNAPGLDFGWFGDDLAHRRFILDHLHGAPSRVAFWNMFDWRDLSDRDHVDAGSLFGRLPWWAAPDFSFALLRPLGTLSHFLDYLLWPTQPWLMHAHNVVLYCVVVALAGALFQRILGPGLWALLATLLFCIDDSHVISTAWIASRNTLLTAAFVLATVLFHVRANERAQRAGTWLTCATLLCAHASSEGAVVVWAYLGAYTLVFDRRPLGQRISALLPLLIASGAWLLGSALAGYGVRGSAVYVDPRYAPKLFLSVVAQRLTGLLQIQFTVAPEAALAWPVPWSGLVAPLSALYGCAIGLGALCFGWSSARIRFFALASIAALLPQCAAGSFTRLMLLSGFAAHGLVLAIAQELWQRARLRSLFITYASASFLIHIALALENPRHALAFSRAVHASVSQAASSLPTGAALLDQRLIVLAFPDYLRSVFIDLYRRELNGPGPRFMDVLGVTPGRVRVARTADAVIELEADGGFLLEPTTLLVRTPSDTFAVGSRVQVSQLTIEVLSITPDGRPAKLRVSGLALAQDSALVYRWNASTQRFARMRLPPLGAAAWLDSDANDVP